MVGTLQIHDVNDDDDADDDVNDDDDDDADDDTAVLIADAANLEQVLTSVIHGAVELTDPVGQKICFAVLRKLVDVWGA